MPSSMKRYEIRSVLYKPHTYLPSGAVNLNYRNIAILFGHHNAK
jgi:hypothetical protein